MSFFQRNNLSQENARHPIQAAGFQVSINRLSERLAATPTVEFRMILNSSQQRHREKRENNGLSIFGRSPTGWGITFPSLLEHPFENFIKADVGNDEFASVFYVWGKEIGISLE